MPLVFVQSYSPITPGTGTQFVTGTLTLSNPTYVEIEPTLFTKSGEYVIFEYGNLVGDVSYLQAVLTGTSFTTWSFTDTKTGGTSGKITLILN